ncbi:MAG: LexA family protein [Desulfovibrio sp.]
MYIDEVLPAQNIENGGGNECPLFLSCVEAGFPSPADDFIEKPLNLHEHVVKNPPATFFVRASGESMKDVGIFSGDILVVDRSINAKNSDIIIASLNGELTVKRIVIKENTLFLAPENPAYPPLEVTEDTAFEIWGVVTHVVHALR